MITKIMKPAIITLMLQAGLSVGIASASSYIYENQKTSCAVFKNNKPIWSKGCQVQGYMYSTVDSYGESSYFAQIPKFGQVAIDVFANAVSDATDIHAGVVAENQIMLNKQPASSRLRFVGSHQVLTPKQQELYQLYQLRDDEGKDWVVYRCYHQTSQPNLEFCFVEPWRIDQEIY